jgi:hypothetical protein
MRPDYHPSAWQRAVKGRFDDNVDSRPTALRVLTPVLAITTVNGYLAEIPQMAPDLMYIFALCPPSCKTEARSGRLPSHWAVRMRVAGFIWVYGTVAPLISCGIGHRLRALPTYYGNDTIVIGHTEPRHRLHCRKVGRQPIGKGHQPFGSAIPSAFAKMPMTIAAGDTELTRTPCSPSSIPTQRVKCTTAAFAAR